MKKKRVCLRSGTSLLDQILLTMKITLFLVFFSLTQLSASVWAQRTNIEVKNASLREIFQQVKLKTGISFMFSNDDVKDFKRMDFRIMDADVPTIMEKCLKGTGLTFELTDQVVVIRKAEIVKQVNDKMEVKGIVKDKSGEFLPGVTVIIKGTNIGTATDMEGKYKLSVPTNEYILVFSMVGMEEQEIRIDVRKTIVNVVMKPAVNELEDVVVTGYFNKSKDSFTGSVTSVKREDLRKFGNVNLIEALNMVDPAFKIKENNLRGSDPNTLPDFFVRGESSFMGNSNIPTFIIDGYEVSLQRVFDMDMERIESITVLKDASATILYGSRASNGVVVIETRRPEHGKFSVSYSNRTGLSAADLSDYNLMDAREKLEYEKKAGIFNYENTEDLLVLESIKANVAKGVNTDWLAQPIRNAVSHAHSLYLEGGTDAIVYGLGSNYSRNNGVMKKSYREIFGISFDLTYRIKDKISIRNSFEYSQTNVRNSPYGSFSLYARANPYNPIYDEDGKLVETYTVHPYKDVVEDQYQNPIYNALLPYKDDASNMAVSENLSLDYFIIPELRFKGALSLIKTVGSSDKYVSPDHGSFKNQNIPATEKGSYTKGNSKGFSYNINATLNYNFQSHKHMLFSGIGLNLVQNRALSDEYKATGFLDSRFNEIWFASVYAKGGKPSGNEAEDRMAGFFANLNYSYNNRYFIDFSGRLDGSSKYGKDKRFAPFWSVGIGWNIIKENFMKNVEWLSRLTLRGSMGKTGNQNFDSYLARTTLRYDTDLVYYESLGASFIAYGNTKLEWQRSLKRNIGLDMEVLERRLTLRMEYYNDHTDGLLLPVSVTPSLGFVNYTENFGKQTNDGYEFDINAVIIRHKHFDWAVNISGTHNRNRITKISNALRSLNKENNTSFSSDQTSPIAMYEEGESLNAIKAVRSLGINPASGKEIFLNRDGGMTENWDYRDKVVVGCTEPALEGNIGTNVIWKNFSLNVLFRYSFGGQVYNSTLAARVEGADPLVNADKRVLEERWQKPGDRTFYKDIADRSISNATSRFVQDNNYLEMSNISLSYHLPENWLKKIGVSDVRIGLNSSELFHISSVKRERGLDYPFAREYTFSLNVNF